MAEAYEHEAANAGTSKQIYIQSWQPNFDAFGGSGVEILANDYYCHS